MEKPDMSIIIVNWNTGMLLQQCVDSILANQGDLSLEVIIIDNASSDDSLSRVSPSEQVKMIVNAENAGYARANNQGFAIANGRMLLMLNPDTLVCPGALTEMLAFMDAHPRVGALGPRLLNPNRTLQPSCSYFPSLVGLLLESLALNRIFASRPFFARPLMSSWPHDTTREVDQPMGAALLLRREVLVDIGLLDERFFVYLEEVDLCYRIKHAGWSIYLLSSAEIIHYGGQSSIRNLDVRIVQRYKSLLLYYAKHFPAWQNSVARGLIVGQMLLRILTLPALRRYLSTRRVANLPAPKLLHYYWQVIQLCISRQGNVS